MNMGACAATEYSYWIHDVLMKICFSSIVHGEIFKHIQIQEVTCLMIMLHLVTIFSVAYMWSCLSPFWFLTLDVLLSRYYIMICCIKSDIPAPLAAKVYYSQRNTRLRSAVAYLYHATSAEGLNMVNSELSQESIMQLLASSQKGSLDAQTNDLINEKVCTYCYFWWLNFHLAVVKCLVLKILEK
jgi:hypothetical protein